MLKNLGVNLNEETAKRASHSLMFMDRFLQQTDEDLGRKRPSGKHAVAKHLEDFKELVNQFHTKGNVFYYQVGREYDKFPGFNRYILKNIDVSRLNKWFNDHKERLANLEQ